MSISASGLRLPSRSRNEPDKEMVSMFTTAEHTTIVTMLAAGKPVWYVAAVTKAHAHDVYAVGATYGYPDRNRLRQALAKTLIPHAA
jgi:lactam utilization protein B